MMAADQGQGMEGYPPFHAEQRIEQLDEGVLCEPQRHSSLRHADVVCPEATGYKRPEASKEAGQPLKHNI